MSGKGLLEGQWKPQCRINCIDAEQLPEVDGIVGGLESLLKLNRLVYAGAIVPCLGHHQNKDWYRHGT